MEKLQKIERKNLEDVWSQAQYLYCTMMGSFWVADGSFKAEIPPCPEDGDKALVDIYQILGNVL